MGAKPRLLLLLPSMVNVGGAERMVDTLSRLLSCADQEVFETSFDPPGARRRFGNTAPFHPLGSIPRLPLFLRPVEYVVAAWRLRQLKKRLAIDVTISNLWRADLINILSCGEDRKIALCHINIIGHPSHTLMLRFRPLVAAVYKRFDRVIAVNEALARELMSLYGLSGRISFIDNFVQRPEVASRLPADGVTRFIWCGRMSAEKNVGGLLRAWSRFVEGRNGAQLVLLGDGPLRADIERLAGELGLRSGKIDDAAAQLVFAGFVAEPAAFMLGARALLLSSVSEGLPMVVLEALSLGLPVLASDCPAGGVRLALQGSGAFDPNRESAEWAPSGALLPVPAAARPDALRLWSEALESACYDENTWEGWRAGALERAAHFSPVVASHRWLDALKF